MEKEKIAFNLKHSLLVWGIADIYFILAVMISVLFAILSPDIQQQLKLNNTQLGLLGTAFFLCYGIAQLFTGHFFDVFGAKMTLGCSALIAGMGLLLMSNSYSFAIALMAKIIIGIGFSTSYVGALYLADNWFPSHRFSLMSGITQMSSNLLTALLVVIMALSGVFMSFRPMMIYLAFIIFANALLIFIFVHNPQVYAGGTPSERDSFLFNMSKLFKIKQYCLGILYFSTSFGVLLSLADLWNIPTQITYRHSLETSAVMNAMFPLGGGIGALISGWVANRIKKPVRVAKIFISGMILVLAILLYGPDFSTCVAFFLLFLLGFLFGGAVLAFPIVSQYISKHLKGMAFGLMAMMAYIMSALLQYGVGAILSHTQIAKTVHSINDYQLALTPLFIVLLIGWFGSLWLKDKHQEI